MPDATHHVFISHAAADKAVADRVCAALESSGVQCWIAPRNIITGESWAKSILDAIASSKLMVLVFSSQTSTSPHVRREIERAVHRNIPIAPLRVEDVLPEGELEYFLSSQHWMDLFPGERDTHIAEVPGKVCALLGIRPTPAKPPAPVMPASDPWGLEIKRDTDDWQQPRPARSKQAFPEVAPAQAPDPPSPGGSRRWIGALVVAALLLALAVYGVLLLSSGSREEGSATTPGGDEAVPAVSDARPRGGPPEAAKPSSLELLRAAFDEDRLSPDDFYLGQSLLKADITTLDEFDVKRREAFELFCSGTLTKPALQIALAKVQTDYQAFMLKRTKEGEHGGSGTGLVAGHRAHGLDLLRKAAEANVITNSIGIRLVLIHPGEFPMGSPADEQGRGNDEAQHGVRLTKSFYLGTTEITQKQWREVMGKTIAQQHENADTRWPLHGEGDNYPMYHVSWEDALEFCRRLSQTEGRHYRLPTEAEWEFACRAGSRAPYGGDAGLDALGWYGDNSGNARIDSRRIWEADPILDTYWNILSKNRCQARPVGLKAPNSWGLYDMHGNVWEWCADWYGSYPEGDVNDPKGPSSGPGRVLRGGSWDSTPRSCRAAYRHLSDPNTRGRTYGFRVALDFP